MAAGKVHSCRDIWGLNSLRSELTPPVRKWYLELNQISLNHWRVIRTMSMMLVRPDLVPLNLFPNLLALWRSLQAWRLKNASINSGTQSPAYSCLLIHWWCVHLRASNKYSSTWNATFLGVPVMQCLTDAWCFKDSWAMPYDLWHRKCVSAQSLGLCKWWRANAWRSSNITLESFVSSRHPAQPWIQRACFKQKPSNIL